MTRLINYKFVVYFFKMDLKHLHSPDEDLVEIGMNLKDYYPSGEWDILNVPAERHAKKYDCCPEFFVGKSFLRYNRW